MFVSVFLLCIHSNMQINILITHSAMLVFNYYYTDNLIKSNNHNDVKDSYRVQTEPRIVIPATLVSFEAFM